MLRSDILTLRRPLFPLFKPDELFMSWRIFISPSALLKDTSLAQSSGVSS